MPIQGPPLLALKLFGTFEAKQAGDAISKLRSQNTRWLIAFLALARGQAVDFETIGRILWLEGVEHPSRADLSRALASVRQSLKDLNQALEGHHLRKPNWSSVQLDLSHVQVDVFAFDAAAGSDDPDVLREAVRLYTGDLLAGYGHAWIVKPREERRQACQRALQALTEDALSGGAFEDAERYLRLSIALDGLKTAQRCDLMRLLERREEYQAAIHIYDEWRALLRAPNAAGGKEIESLHRSLQAKVQASRRGSSVPSGDRGRMGTPHVPYPVGVLIGREQAIAETAARLTFARLVTLKGPPGVGKTQLALHVASRLQEDYPDGSAFVDLTETTEPNQIFEKVAVALRVQVGHKGSVAESVLAFLGAKHLLLVLDNCERLATKGVPAIQSLLRECPNLRLLATGRRAFSGVTGARVYSVLPLTLPESHLDGRPPDKLVSTLSQVSSVRLFIERANDLQPGFVLTTHNALAVARLCQRLDGLPLALELAATWIQTLSVDQMLVRLEGEAEGPGALSRKLPRNHRVLLDTIANSFHFLPASQQRFFVRLCVFRGGCTLEAAQAVCGMPEAAEYLSELQDRSLVVSEQSGETLRFRLLETIRQYGTLRLQNQEEVTAVFGRHLDFFAGLAQSYETELIGPNQAACLDRLESDHDNFRAALEYASRIKDAEQGLRLASAMWRFWYTRSYYREGYDWLVRMLEIGPDAPTEARIKAHGCAGNLAYRLADYAVARIHFEARLGLEEATGNTCGIASALGSLANVASSLGDRYGARQMFERSLALFRETQDLRGVSFTLSNLAVVACGEGDYAGAGAYHEESIALFRQAGDAQNLALALNNLADTKLSVGEYATVPELLRESLAIGRSLEIKHSLLHSLSLCFCLATKQGQWERATVIQGAAESLRGRLGLGLPQKAAEESQRLCQAILEATGPEAYYAALAHGCALAEAEAVGFVIVGL